MTTKKRDPLSAALALLDEIELSGVASGYQYDVDLIRDTLRDLEAQLKGQTVALNPEPQWKPLLADNLLQVDEGTTYLFAIEVDGGWEYFSDAIGWDADEETVPTWRDGNHGWSIESVTHYAKLPAPPVQAKETET